MKFAAIPFLLVFALNLLSQDLIVTHEGDSINVYISNIGNNKIFYTKKTIDSYKSSTVKKNDLRSYILGYFIDLIESENRVINIPEMQHYRFAISSGYSRINRIRLNEVIDPYISYVNNIGIGLRLNGEFTYFHSQSWGWGIIASVFNKRLETSSIIVKYPGGRYQFYDAIDDITISFFGPTYTTRSVSFDNKKSSYLSISLGYLRYRNRYEFIEKSIATGRGFALMPKFGFDVQLVENLHIGLEASYMLGGVGNIKLKNGADANSFQSSAINPSSLKRFDASFGLRYNW